MESKEGVELFVHFGIDTVELKGKALLVLHKKGNLLSVAIL